MKTGGAITNSLVEVQYLRSDSQQEHIFLNPMESVTYNASAEENGMSFDSFSVEVNSTNPGFLRELSTDLYIESYDYFGVLGSWTSNNNFTITNPTSSTQELFLNIARNYIQTAYAVGTVSGPTQSIEFTSGPAADRVFVKWGFFASLSSLEINGSQVDFSNPNPNTNTVRLEFEPTYCSFQIPSQRLQGTHFILKLEEQNLPPPSGYSYISAFLQNDTSIAVEPNQQYLFNVPNVSGWNFLTAAAYTNLTLSLYPQPYPFQLVNLSVWDPTSNPLLTTALGTTFGVRNISNQTYTLSFDVLYYYWENQTALTSSHEIIESDTQYITHEITANVSNANVGADLGLIGQYLLFQVPGKTISYDAPNPVGKYEDAYIPLSTGSYTLVTQESRIVANITSKVDDLHLSNTLSFHVTYNGDPFANAEISVIQRGTFTSRTYSASTNQNGEATIIVYSNGPGSDKLNITITKDEFNYTEQTVSYFVGASWIATIAVVAVVVATIAFFLVKRLRKQRLTLTRDSNSQQRHR